MSLACTQTCRPRRLRPTALAGLLFLFFSACSTAAELDSVNLDLLSLIESAETDLSTLENSISSERQALARQLNDARNSIEDLRTEAAAYQRLNDEQTLSLSQLENRLEAWQQQSAFQTRLVNGFSDLIMDSAGTDGRDAPEQGLEAQLRQLVGYVREQEARLYPQWQAGDIILPDGRISPASTLQLGPVAWYWQEDAGQGGLFDPSGDTGRVALAFEGSAGSQMATFYQNREGMLTFDPTLSRAMALEGEQESILQHLQKGGIWVIPIMAFAVFAIVIALFKSFSLWRLPTLLPALPARLEHALKEGGDKATLLHKELSGPQADLVTISLNARSAEQRDDHLFASLLEHRHQLERWLGAIAVTASVAPLLGLLGTVSGMITTFRLMTLFGAGDPSAVSSGISEALVTTELGLIVAIPALLAHALMSRSVKNYYGQLENNAIQLSQIEYPVKPGGRPDA